MAAADDGCTPVHLTVVGAGSVGSPYTITPVVDLSRMFSLDGDEPWTLGTVDGCSALVPQAHEMV